MTTHPEEYQPHDLVWCSTLGTLGIVLIPPRYRRRDTSGTIVTQDTAVRNVLPTELVLIEHDPAPGSWQKMAPAMLYAYDYLHRQDQ